MSVVQIGSLKATRSNWTIETEKYERQIDRDMHHSVNSIGNGIWNEIFFQLSVVLPTNHFYRSKVQIFRIERMLRDDYFANRMQEVEWNLWIVRAQTSMENYS